MKGLALKLFISLLTLFTSSLLVPKGHRIVPLWTAPPMAMKGIFKGFRVVSQIFTVKEREMEIGCPTDVKHVAHIGWGSTSTGNASPSWINDITASADLSSFRSFAAASTGTSWASQDHFDLQPRDASPFPAAGSENTGHQQGAMPLCPGVPKPPRKARKRKDKDGSPPRPSSSGDSSSLSSAPSSAALAAPAAADGTL